MRVARTNTHAEHAPVAPVDGNGSEERRTVGDWAVLCDVREIRSVIVYVICVSDRVHENDDESEIESVSLSGVVKRCVMTWYAFLEVISVHLLYY